MFDQALELVLKFEGGYADDPDDPGGATNKGITQNTYNRYRTSKRKPMCPVRQIEPSEVREIYERSYWDASQCNLFDHTHPATAQIHFDCAVNCGTGTAIRLLQDILEVPVDGMFGKITLNALRITPDSTVARLYLARRKLYYQRVILKNPTSRKFISSWYYRLNTLARKNNILWSTAHD